MPFNNSLEILLNAIRKGNKNIGKEEIKLSLFANDMAA